jgi:hypothetical protein
MPSVKVLGVHLNKDEGEAQTDNLVAKNSPIIEEAAHENAAQRHRTTLSMAN